MTRPATIFWFLLALALFSTAAAAVDLEPNADGGRNPEARWRRGQIPIVFSTSLLKTGSSIRPDSDVQGAIRRSLETWEAAVDIEFQVSWSDKTAISPTGGSGDGISLVTIAPIAENLLVFSGEASEIAARTRVFYNRRGEISEADIVLNPYQQFSTDGAIGTFDLESTLVHEIGHLLGLDHSPLAGATMNEFQGKNGIFNLANFSPRTLSLDDLTRIRSLYPSSADDCCGSVDGRIAPASGRGGKSLSVWLEEPETGRIVVAARTAADGGFSIRGLTAGTYSVYLQDPAGGGQKLDDIQISRGKTTVYSKKTVSVARNYDVRFAGLIGQLSRVAVPLNGGRTYQLFLGGKNLRPEELTVGTTSPFIGVSKPSPARLDYGREMTVLTVEISAAAEIPLGEYTIYVENRDGTLDFLPGALTVEKFSNPWSITSFE
ncbi:MAG: matrixin family metalloprotease [Acidobacteria bacterium]|nr:matrixin family metalloprotease [Acidobacteriota bacterium]